MMAWWASWGWIAAVIAAAAMGHALFLASFASVLRAKRRRRGGRAQRSTW